MPEQSLKQYPQRIKVIPSNRGVSRTKLKNKYRNTNLSHTQKGKMYIWHPIKKCQGYKEARLYDPLLKEKLVNRHPPTTDTGLRVRQQGY